MTSIAALIGLDRTDLAGSAASLSGQSRVDPQDYPSFARDAKRLDQDVRIAYTRALATRQGQEQAQDRAYLERAREFVELDEQVQTSTQLLTELATFLSTFQTDLSAVSGHISQLQGRSKTIEGRLQARRAVERSLQPFLESITISPELITLILETRVSREWIPHIVELDSKLGAIRGGARIPQRSILDRTAETLRLTATEKISVHLNSLLKPFTTSISPRLSLSNDLYRDWSEFKPLFDFLRRHSARTAHQVQKNFTNTVRWYLETGFRRYVRSLEGLRTRPPPPGGTTSTGGQPRQEGFRWEELVSSTNDGQASLALLNAKKRGGGGTPVLSARGGGTNLTPNSKSAILNSRLDPARTQRGEPRQEEEEEKEEEEEEEEDRKVMPVITAWQTGDKNLRPTYERLFRSISIVLAHNASQAFEFIDSFFGVHSTLPSPTAPAFGTTTATTGSTDSSLTTGSLRRFDSNGSISAFSSASSAAVAKGGHDPLPAVGELGGGGGGGDQQSESSKTVTNKDAKNRVDQDKMRKVLVEGLWKSVMDPALEYSLDFVHALLTAPSAPSPLSLLSMIRLNSSLLSHCTSDPSSAYRCPPLESHLYSIRLLLWPLFTKTLDAQIEALKKINGTPAPTSSTHGGTSSVVGGLLGRMSGAGGGASSASSSVKDSTVQSILERYVEWFVTVVEICREPNEEEDEAVFQPMLRLRNELDRLLVHQSLKIPDPVKQKAFLKAGYQEILSVLSAGLTRHERVQKEIAHYRELIRKVQ